MTLPMTFPLVIDYHLRVFPLAAVFDINFHEIHSRSPAGQITATPFVATLLIVLILPKTSRTVTTEASGQRTVNDSETDQKYARLPQNFLPPAPIRLPQILTVINVSAAHPAEVVSYSRSVSFPTVFQHIFTTFALLPDGLAPLRVVQRVG